MRLRMADMSFVPNNRLASGMIPPTDALAEVIPKVYFDVYLKGRLALRPERREIPKFIATDSCGMEFHAGEKIHQTDLNCLFNSHVFR